MGPFLKLSMRLLSGLKQTLMLKPKKFRRKRRLWKKLSPPLLANYTKDKLLHPLKEARKLLMTSFKKTYLRLKAANVFLQPLTYIISETYVTFDRSYIPIPHPPY